MSFVNYGHQEDFEVTRRFWFDVSEVPVSDAILGCELRIYKKARGTSSTAYKVFDQFEFRGGFKKCFCFGLLDHDEGVGWFPTKKDLLKNYHRLFSPLFDSEAFNTCKCTINLFFLPF